MYKHKHIMVLSKIIFYLLQDGCSRGSPIPAASPGVAGPRRPTALGETGRTGRRRPCQKIPQQRACVNSVGYLRIITPFIFLFLFLFLFPFLLPFLFVLVSLLLLIVFLQLQLQVLLLSLSLLLFLERLLGGLAAIGL